jgi:hypothetical protein
MENERPKCMECGKMLAKETFYVDAREPLVVGDEIPHPHDHSVSVTVKQITHQFGYNVTTRKHSYSAWFGDYGVGGNGLFCTKTCACRFGITVARQIKDGMRLCRLGK